MFDEQRAQQGGNVQPVGIRIRQYAHLVVPQPTEIRARWVHAYGQRNVMHFLRSEYLIGVHFPSIQDFARRGMIA